MSLYHEDPLIREQIDGYLSLNATSQANLGIEDTVTMYNLKLEAKAYWLTLLEKIRTIDPEFAQIVEPQE